MPRGFSAVAAAAKDRNERKNAGGNFTSRKYLRLPNDGDKATVRFLESGDEVNSAWMHVVPHPKFQWGIKIPCLDQDPETGERIGKDCPGCEANDGRGYPRKFQGFINLIWYDAPVYETNEDGKVNFNKIVGNEDQVVIWQSGVETFEELQIQDETYGLDTRQFVVRRRGTGKNTSYSVLAVDGGPTEMSKSDKALAEDKYDLNELITPPAYEVWGKRGSSEDESEEQTPVRESPFANRRR
jgi:hypothetical protein